MKFSYLSEMRLVVVIIISLISLQIGAQQTEVSDSLSVQLFERGRQNVNKCSPWHHLQCVFITGTEVYKDGREGKPTRHWWRMSYIGRACTAQHGRTFGKIFETLFAIPHYLGVGIGNGIGYTVYLVRGSPDKIKKRKRSRK